MKAGSALYGLAALVVGIVLGVRFQPARCPT